MDVPHYWTAKQVQRLLHQLAEQARYPPRTAALIMWRTGLRVSEVLELEWRDLDYQGGAGNVARPQVEDAEGVHGSGAPGAGAAVHQLAVQPGGAEQGGGHQHEDGAAAHWPMRWWPQRARGGVARDREAASWSSLTEALGGTTLADGREGAAQRGQLVAGSRFSAGHVEDLFAHRGPRLSRGERAVAGCSPQICLSEDSRLSLQMFYGVWKPCVCQSAAKSCLIAVFIVLLAA